MSKKGKKIVKNFKDKGSSSIANKPKIDSSLLRKPRVDYVSYLQRRVGNQAVQRLFKSGIIQAKLSIGKPGDKYEKEADMIADQVMRMPEMTTCLDCKDDEEATLQTEPITTQISPLVRRQIEPEEQEEEEPIQTKLEPSLLQKHVEEENEVEEPIQAKSNSSSTAEVSSSVESNINSLKGGGQPLSESTREYFEPKFGYDFSGVRVHNDSKASEVAGSINAKAFTSGKDVVFGAGEYSPETDSGKHLLAHELTHVVQQHAGPGTDAIQRAEVDDRSCKGLDKIESDIDSKVNQEIDAARKETKPNSWWPFTIDLFLQKVMEKLGKGAVSPIEHYIITLSDKKRRLPASDLAGTKYHGAKDVKLIYKGQGIVPVVAATVNIGGICIGADKLGHFFAEGYGYFKIQSSIWRSKAEAESTGRALEIGKQGLYWTGVYSNADLAANSSGMRFYKDLAANPGLKFSIKSYISPLWNEKYNPSFYEKDLAIIVWKNLLTGLWQGLFSSKSNHVPVGSKVTLNVTTNRVTGTYERQEGKGISKKGKIKNGTISHKTTKVSGAFPGEKSESATPVSGVLIEFDWEEETSSGKGRWDSADEQTLMGTWGIGSSRTNGGTWKLKKF